jgi:hypothetical protein
MYQVLVATIISAVPINNADITRKPMLPMSIN